jgi:hypothetical protein
VTNLIVFRPPGQNGQISAIMAVSGHYAGDRPFWPNSDSFGRNPANSDFDMTVRILAFIL